MNKRFLKVELKRTLFSWNILISFVLFMAVFINISNTYKSDIPVTPQYPKLLALEGGNCFINFIEVMGNPRNSYMTLVFPLIILILIGDSLFLDYKTNFLQFSLTRIGYKKYIRYKTIAVALIAFIFTFLFQIVGFLYSLFTNPYYLPTKAAIENDMAPLCASQLYVNNPYIYIFIVMIIFSIIAMVISTLGIIASTLAKNTFYVIGVPWILYVLICEIIYIITPYIWNFLRNINPLNMIGVILFMEGSNLIYIFLYWILLLVATLFISHRLTLRKFKLDL